MALINNNYVLVTNESVEYATGTTSHPTEQGLPLSDTVQKQPVSVNLTGKIVDTEHTTAKDIVNKLKSLQSEGSLITYVGQAGTIKNLQIQSFNTDFNNKNNGGADFDMSLKEARIAKKAYVSTQKPIAPIVQEAKTDFEENDIVWFTGGDVFVSSNAKKPSARGKGASECKLTKIAPLKNRHIYHLISQDCKYGSSHYVYGWVDASKVKANLKKVPRQLKKGGTQQITKI